MAKTKLNTGGPKAEVRIDAVKHRDTRKNIPTEELRDFVADEELKPKAMLYPRNPDLDPQLVWKGKDEQDAAPLEVPVVPVYIQEKVHPQAIIEDFRKTADKRTDNDNADFGGLFADFNGLPEEFDQRVDFYHHDGHWSNRLILGDSLLVMTSLAEKEGLKGKVQMVYFDPPYGIKFGSNWQVSTRKRDVKEKAEDVVRQPEQIKAFRDTWQLGIHSYLAYLRDRMVAAHNLLTDSGSIFIQIGDENVHLVRAVLDEVFGASNFMGQISVAKTTSATNEYLPLVCDYLIWYAKAAESAKYRQLFKAKDRGGAGAGHYSMIELEDGTRRGATADERSGDRPLPAGARLFAPGGLESASMGREKGEGAACWFPVCVEGKEYLPNAKSRWKTNEAGMRRLVCVDRVIGQQRALRYVRFLEDFPAYVLNNLWDDVGGASDKTYVVETAPEVVKRCILMTTDPGDLVLDPTCGSGTTAYVAEQWGRRWITTDTSRVALTLARTRLMAGRFPYYYLADSPEGIAKEAEVTGTPAPRPLPRTECDPRKGFVYRRVPHVTLKSIANNEEIDSTHAKWQAKLEPVREKLNKLLKQKWEEWQVPRDPEEKWPKEAAKLHGEWWENRRMRQKEIDASIARKADTETLYDQPYEDPKRVRVAGPFTVESLSPHRTISVEEKVRRATAPDENQRTVKVYGTDKFGQMILENLRAAGVQNTKKGERLKFDSIEPFAGQWIHGEGRYADADGKPRRAAICIGPEHGTVGAQLVKEAAKEAVQGVGFDMLLVCGFAFDPVVSEEAKRYGRLTVLPTRINPDLAMGELLKKTGAGNLFMVFGEPDVSVMSGKDGKVTVEIRGLDVYDPTTGEVRSSSTDDIACWFIDTDYNGESFFVRHAYFTGADEPYEKLKRALRAEIDEAAWSALYSTKSRPFEKPTTGRIAVKVINHYGDEVLKVFSID